MTGSDCPWCGHDKERDMPEGVSPHSTWCVHYRRPKQWYGAISVSYDENGRATHRQRDNDGKLI
jgi:hypothetical protein